MARRVGFGDGRKPGSTPRGDGPGWEAYLDDDEELLWTGAPDSGVHVSPSDIPKSAFGLFFLSFAIFWTYLASSNSAQAGGLISVVFPLFGLPFILVGAYLVGLRFFWDAFRRGKTRYALTNQRAIIATSVPGRSMASYPIHAMGRIVLEPGPPDTVTFATRTVRGRRGHHGVPVGFEFIEDGAQIERLLRGLLRDRTGQG